MSLLQTESRLVAAQTITANELTLLEMARQTLEKHYPGHFWQGGVSGDGSMFYLRNGLLAGDMGMALPIPHIYSASSFEADVKRAGGELLEHYNQRRAAMDLAAIVNLPTDFSGRHKPEM